MKNPKLGDYIKWKGDLARIIGGTDKRTIIIEMAKNCKCPHCDGDLGVEQIHVIPSAPLFQGNAESVQTMGEDDPNLILA